jgi:hypothetical protein
VRFDEESRERVPDWLCAIVERLCSKPHRSSR